MRLEAHGPGRDATVLGSGQSCHLAWTTLAGIGWVLTTGPGWSAAVFAYNHSQSYVDSVYLAASTYASRTSG